MSELSFFQRYSQKENHITNNTLLMLRMIYRSHPNKLQTVLESLLTDDEEDGFELHIGPSFEQQVRGSDSVPDAVIDQQGFSLLIEVKPEEKWDESQILRHIKTAQDYTSGTTILLLLSKARDPNFNDRLKREAKENNVVLVHGTFQALIDILDHEDLVADHETDLQEIVNDFIDLLWADGLLDDPYALFAFGCSQSLEWNLENEMYFDHITRPSKFEVLTGFYAKKEIHAIGRIGATVIGSLEEGFKVEKAQPGINKKDVLKKVETAAKKRGVAHSSDPLRWYVYSDLVKTSFRKSTPYGYFQGVRIHLKKAVGDQDIDPTNISELAQAIDNKTFDNDRGY